MSDAADFKEQVRARTDVVELIGESVSLSPRRGGSEFVGLCPFHDDHNPSMCVYPDRQSYRCWVCDAGGDAFTFVMKHEGVSFVEALDLLAERAGLERPKRSGPSNNGGPDKPRLYDVLAWADRQFRTCLKAGREAQEARDYLAGRGVSPEMVERFGLGFVPRDWQWLLNRARGTYTAKDLQAAGLTKERRDGSGLIDFFVERVMFPIRDERGRVVSFGGRILPGRGEEAGPKYLNGGDTAVFAKSKLVFALDLAREAIKKAKTAVVMEGYTDVIAAHQAGYANVVATLGTALAESHVSLLRRFADRVVLVYDGDDAGRNAAERALARFLAQDVDLRILTLPGGLDPADYLANDTRGGFGELLASAPEALEFKLTAAVTRFGVDTVDGRSRIASEVLATAAAAPRLAGTVREQVILHRVAERLAVPEQSLRDELRRLRDRSTPSAPRARPQTPQNQKTIPSRPDDPAEREVLSALLVRPDLFEVLARQIGPDDFATPRLRAAFEHCRDVADLHGTVAYDLLMSCTDDADLKQLLVGLDADARAKGLAARLEAERDGRKDVGPDGAGPQDGAVPPPLFLEVTQTLVRRRVNRRLDEDVGELRRLASGAGGTGLDESAKERLRQYQQRLAAARHVP